MRKPYITNTSPETLPLESGVYSWCTCGYSKIGALCDGSHIGKGFCPMTFDLDTPKTVVLCQCRHTQNPPYCDGSHRQLSNDEA